MSWVLSRMEFLLGFGVPLLTMAANIFVKRVLFGRSIDTAGADLTLCGFAVLLGQTFRAMHAGLLGGDVGVIAVIVLFIVMGLWLFAHKLVEDRPEEITAGAAASWVIGGLTLYGCILFWDALRDMGYTVR